MTINRAFALPAITLCLALSACDGAVPRAGERQPSHRAPVAVSAPLPPPRRAPFERPPTPPPPPPPPVAADWRDVPLPAGDWTWIARADGGEARFGVTGQPPVAILACDRAHGTVQIALPNVSARAAADGAQLATITTSTANTAFTAGPRVIDGLATLAIALPVASRTLDAMAFSRGRIRVAIADMRAVVLPSWAEVGRVVEDCRG
jgi:hypothetical protein